MASAVNPALISGSLRALYLCFSLLSLSSFSSCQDVEGCGCKVGLADHPVIRAISKAIEDLDEKVARRLANEDLFKKWRENYAILDELPGKTEALQLVTTQHLEEIHGLKSKLVEQEKKFAQFQKTSNSFEEKILETVERKAETLRNEVKMMELVFNDTMTKEVKERAQETEALQLVTNQHLEEIQGLKDRLVEQEKKLTQLEKTSISSEEKVLETVERKAETLKDEVKKMLDDTMTKEVKERAQEIQTLKSTLVEQDKKFTQFRGSLNSFEEKVLETVKSKTDALKTEVIVMEQLFNDTMTKLRKEGAREIQSMKNTLVEQGNGLVQIKETLKASEERVPEAVQRKINVLSTAVGLIKQPARTCQELVDIDPNLVSCCSGICTIDPDGWNIGDPPIRVHCEKSGETVVMHDSMGKIVVKECEGAGCYSRNITYTNATMRQVNALVQLSSNCSQHLRYDCFATRLSFSRTGYAADRSWWIDRNGKTQYYWTGNSLAYDGCLCGLSGTCVRQDLKCNCDILEKRELFDEGLFTNMDHLPLTRLNFGLSVNHHIRSRPIKGNGEHTLGPLRCFGAHHVKDKKPTSWSCADHWRSGRLRTGLYEVQRENGGVDTLHCDMSKLPDETGFQTLINPIVN